MYQKIKKMSTTVQWWRSFKKNAASRGSFLVFGMMLFALGMASSILISCEDDIVEDENNIVEEYLPCEKIRSSASTFTKLEANIGHTYADYFGYSKLWLKTNNHVNDTISKSFIVAESEINSKKQTFTLKNVPDEYLGDLIYDSYKGEYIGLDPNTNQPMFQYYKEEGYKNFQLLAFGSVQDSKLNINISNKNTKIAIIKNGYIWISAKGQMMNDDGYLASTAADLSPNDEKMECYFSRGDLVYSNSDCDITGYFENGDIVNIDVHLRKGWNKIFHFNDRIITTDDIKDGHLLWYQHAG